MLVRMTMVKESRGAGFIVSSHRIDHVYYGGVTAEGKEVEYHHPEPGRIVISGPRYLSKAPQIGDTAIWLVKSQENKLIPLVMPSWGILLPSFDKNDESYHHVERLARILEEYRVLNDSEKLEFLRIRTESEEPIVGYWAVLTIAQEKPETYAKALDHLVRKKELSIAAQVALDQALLQVQREFWQHSDVRFEMIRAWISIKVTPYETRLVLDRLTAIRKSAATLGFPDERQRKIEEALSTGSPGRP